MPLATHSSVLDALGRRIAGGELAPGTVLTLAVLEKDYAVSRTVIREAVRVLEAMSLVESRRRVGVTVTAMSRWNALDPVLIGWRFDSPARTQQLISLTELRLAVEPAAARLTAERASEEARSEIARLATRLQELGNAGLGDSDEYLKADIAFHNCLLDSCGNLMLRAIKEPVAQMISGRHYAGLTPGIPVHKSLHNHVQAASAIVRGDADAAEHHVRSYVESILGEVRSLG